MQKKLLAIAVGATMVAAPMFAQADVKLKGQVAVELANTDGGQTLGDASSVIDSNTRQGDYNGRSRIVIDASKDLGNGLKAIGRYAFNLNPSDGGYGSSLDPLKSRDQYVGLAGGWGAAVAGRLPTPYKMNGGVKWDPFVATFMQARGQGGMSSGALGTNSFVNDVLAYVMPELAGINATFAYIASDDQDSGVDSGTYTLGGTGKWGPVEVIAAWTTAKLAGDADDIEQGKIGIRYKGNGLVAAWQYEAVDAGGKLAVNGQKVGFGDTTATMGTGDFNFLNLGYKFGNTLIAGNYGKFNGDDAADGNTDYAALGVTYFFDKKVRIYGGWSMTDVDQVENFGNSSKYDTWGAGMRYDF
jgi:predicted porin